ncbi:MAG TPA: protein translocase subunit SecF [Thermoanaerobaculia bacterium]|nr:protein translocase subunit SecF [Thermoanaerobaculia bacterium]
MQFLQDAHFDFMKHRRLWAVVSAVFVLIGILAVFVHGKLNVGIDFTGGTQLIVRFQETQDPEELRRVFAGAGMPDAQLQRFGPEGSGEVMIRTPLRAGEGEGAREVEAALAALNARFNPDRQGLDLNRRGTEAVTATLLRADPAGLVAADEALARQYYEEVAEAVLDTRQDLGIFTSWEQVAALEGIEPEVVQALQQEGHLGSFALVGQEFVGPTVGAELRQKGLWAVALSILGMLAYIWVRFELRFGIGAMLAVLHDVTVALGLYAWMDYEFNLTTIAAFLTLVGYSVNDTVVIFDRVRENMRKSRRQPLEQVINESVNQTLSRTILTSGTTMLAVGALYVFGGDVLRGFAFVLLVGIVVGTYSTIWVASPFALFWEHWMGKREARRGAGPGRERAEGGRGDKDDKGVKAVKDEKRVAAAGDRRRG